jgi:hydrogenase expression/formation protein HypC
MCLGIPGQVVGFVDETDQLAKVAVTGVTRDVNVALVKDEGLQIGDWVLIHLGFAMAIIDEAEAERAMEGLRLLGEQPGPEDSDCIGATGADPLFGPAPPA